MASARGGGGGRDRGADSVLGTGGLLMNRHSCVERDRSQILVFLLNSPPASNPKSTQYKVLAQPTYPWDGLEMLRGGTC